MYEYRIGQKVSFNYKGKIVEAIITRINQKTLSVEADNLKGRVGYGCILGSNTSTTIPSTPDGIKCPNLERSEYYTKKDLEELTEEIKEQYSFIFQNLFNDYERDLLQTVRISWGKRYTYRRLGTYYHSRSDLNKFNVIKISKSLQHTPKFVIQETIYHELLHIKFHKHGKEFRSYERKYNRKSEANGYTSSLCMEIKYHGVERLMRLPITEKKPRAKIIDNKFMTPTGLVLDLNDKYDRKFYEMNYL